MESVRKTAVIRCGAAINEERHIENVRRTARFESSNQKVNYFELSMKNARFLESSSPSSENFRYKMNELFNSSKATDDFHKWKSSSCCCCKRWKSRSSDEENKGKDDKLLVRNCMQENCNAKLFFLHIFPMKQMRFCIAFNSKIILQKIKIN